jgi:CRISPR-associated protein Cmr3
MSTAYLTITPHDPVIARDARPFTFGVRMKSLDWLYPSVIAGSFRTMLGKKAMLGKKEYRNCNFDDANIIKSLKSVSVAGPLPVWKNTLFFPAPKDFHVREQNGQRTPHPVRPTEIGTDEHCDFLYRGLLPALLPESIGEFKPAKYAPLWSLSLMAEWLANPDGSGFTVPAPLKKKDSPETSGSGSPIGGLNLPEKESRFHVSIRPETLVAEEQMFFETIGLDLNLRKDPEGVQMAARVSADNEFGKLLPAIDGFAPTGGKRRLSRWKTADKEHAGWTCPPPVSEALDQNQKVRMVLATPALFRNGWLPGWLDDTGSSLEGCPPASSLKLRLVSACTERWKPLSGCSLEKASRGFKPLRRMVPAGSVYFFEVAGGGTAGDLANLWLQPVSDDEQDRCDGFGLALWGVWNAPNNTGTIGKNEDD